jgi:hypothetical protein
VSCQPGAACGAISLRRLPPPVAHIALDLAGFDPERFGLLGVVRVAGEGYEVVLPRQTLLVERGRPRPVAVPVTALGQAEDAAADDDAPTYWVLLSATGEGDNMLKVTLIGAGLALLLGALYSAVRTVSVRGSARLTLVQERAIAAGLTALLGLMLTRVTVGARVAFFDPFLERGIGTAVGLCVAIAVVIVGLLTWSAWLPPFMAGARSAFAGQVSPGRLLRGAWLWAERLGGEAVKPAGLQTLAFAAPSLALLTLTTGAAPWQGLLTGAVVLLVWVCVAWVVAFTGSHFDTYERGAHSVVEQLSPPRPIPAAPANSASFSATVRRLFVRVPELNIIVAFAALLVAHMLPRIALTAAAAVLIAALVVIVHRRRGTKHGGQPDHVAAAAGVAAFGACIAALRLASENGSLGAFILVVFVALASVRIGRGVGARLEARARASSEVRGIEWLAEALLLTTPLFLLLPLAGIDMGLVLVLVIPLGFATLLATGARAAGRRLVVPAAAMLLLVLLGWQVVFPSLRPIRDAGSHAAQAEAFDRMSTLAGARLPFLSTPLDRAAARSVATRDRPLAEALLVAAGPGTARDLLVPSIEQIWGTRAYASAGLWGEGLGQAAIGGRGVAETVSYAENTFAVFVLAEHGAVGGMLVLALYGLLTIAVAVLILGRSGGTPSYRASRALFLVAALIVAIPACYVALSNVGVVPITGQNMPFLGLNAWSDVAICAGVIGILITGTLRGLEEAGR